MKFVFLILIFCLTFLFASAQIVKPYLAIVKTANVKQKGILYKVDSAGIIVNLGDSTERINYSNIKWVKLRVIKKSDQEFINFVSYHPWSKDNFEINNGGVLVRKWGEKDPTFGEEIGGHVATALINVTGNILATPFQSINPSIANFKINGDSVMFAQQMDELSYFSVYYQKNSDLVTELKKIKQIAVSFKP